MRGRFAPLFLFFWIAFIFLKWVDFHASPDLLGAAGLYLNRWQAAWGGWEAFLPAVFRNLRAVFASLLLISACRMFGAQVRRLLARRHEHPGAPPAGILRISEVAVGIAVIGGLTLAGGLVGLIRGAFGVPVLLVGAAGLVRWIVGVRLRRSIAIFAGGLQAWVLVLPVFLLVVLDFLAALGPEFFYDALICHLAAPDTFLRSGRVTWLDSMHPTAAPMAPQFAAMVLQGMAGEPGVRLFHWIIVLLAGYAAAEFARRMTEGGTSAAWLGFGLWLSLPMLAWETEIAFTDGTWAVAYGLAVYWAIFVRHGSSMALVLALAACSGKYPALPHALIIGGFLLVRSRHRLGVLTVGAGAAAVLVTPWLAKNWLWTGDPLYPHLAGLGLGFSFPAEGLRMLHDEWRNYGFGLSIFLPWDVTMHDMDGRYWSETLGPIPLLLLPLVLIRIIREKSVPMVVVASACAVWFGIWAATGQVSRYLMPVLVPAMGVLMSTVWGLAGHARMLASIVIAVWIWFAPLYRIQHRVSRSLAIAGEQVVTGARDLRTFQTARSPSRVNPWLEAHSNRQSHVLLLQEESTYGLAVPATASHLYDLSVLDRAAGEVDSLPRIRVRLRQRGITHILLNDEQDSRFAEGTGRLSTQSARARNLLSEFWTWMGDPSHRSGMVSIWRLRGRGTSVGR